MSLGLSVPIALCGVGFVPVPLQSYHHSCRLIDCLSSCTRCLVVHIVVAFLGDSLLHFHPTAYQPFVELSSGFHRPWTDPQLRRPKDERQRAVQLHWPPAAYLLSVQRAGSWVGASTGASEPSEPSDP
jgi:hypothetical protein